MRDVKTIEVDRYEKAEDGIHYKHVGMIKAQEAFDVLKEHLKKVDLLPDEYFSFAPLQNRNEELPEFSTAVCHTDWGGNEGIYIDISLESYTGKKRESFSFAVGKTLDSSGEAFLKMSRIAAECSIMLNGRGAIVKIPDRFYETEKAPEESVISLNDRLRSAEKKRQTKNEAKEVVLEKG